MDHKLCFIHLLSYVSIFVISFHANLHSFASAECSASSDCASCFTEIECGLCLTNSTCGSVQRCDANAWTRSCPGKSHSVVLYYCLTTLFQLWHHFLRLVHPFEEVSSTHHRSIPMTNLFAQTSWSLWRYHLQSSRMQITRVCSMVSSRHKPQEWAAHRSVVARLTFALNGTHFVVVKRRSKRLLTFMPTASYIPRHLDSFSTVS